MDAHQTLPSPAPGTSHSLFLAMLPTIESRLRREFRYLDPDGLEEVVQEGVANCYQAFVRLADRGRAQDYYAPALARFAARQIRAGRNVGGPMNSRDPLSRYAQRKHHLVVERLDQESREAAKKIEAAITDRRMSVPERAALRVDVPRWLQSLSRRTRRIAKDLALGHTTSEVAAMYALSTSRVSQIRRELYQSWRQFHAAVGRPG